jgi:AraC-like DNA-binding protein
MNSDPVLFDTPHPFQVAAVLADLHRRYADPAFTLQEAAAAASVSKYHLCRMLSKHTGRSFSQHVRNARIQEACELCSTTALSIKEVAARVGYANTNALVRNFRRATGVTPAMYRIQRRAMARDA